jgi:hypothetical protein
VKKELILKLFPNASASVLAANNDDDTPSPKVPYPEPKRNKKAALERMASGEKEGFPRVIVCFTGFRVKPLDPDNFAGSVKDVIDGLRTAGLIPGDENWRIRLITDQVKVQAYFQERTELEIIYPAFQSLTTNH